MVKEVKMDQDFPQMAEEMLIEDVETLKVLADPGRIQIMRSFDQPRTVKEVADYLDRPATKLYYHVNMLEKHGIIQVVETNVVSGIIEKKYQVSAKRYRPVPSLLTATEMDAHLEAVLTAVFDTAKRDIKSSIEAGLMDLGHKEGEPLYNSVISHSKLHLTIDQMNDLRDRLEGIFKEYMALGQSAKTPNVAPYGLVIGFYPLSHSEGDSNHE
jgi:DNA-binding transcriptional ArsR family regulator